MSQLKHGGIMTHFQQIFAAFCGLIAEICILLFFLLSASKSQQLLITDKSTKTNQFQREFDSNVHIATFEILLASKRLASKTNLFKPFFLTFLCVLCVLRGEFAFVFADRLNCRDAEMPSTNRIQREFLFNDAIASQNKISYSGFFGKIQTFLNFHSGIFIIERQN
jgi:hypothetical protein